MAFATNVGVDFIPVSQSNASVLTLRGVWLLRSHCRHFDADTALLRRVQGYRPPSKRVEGGFERRSVDLVGLADAGLSQ